MRVEAAIFGREGRVKQRRVALAQSDHVSVIVEEGKQLAIAPHAALIERRVAHAALAEGALERGGIGIGRGVAGFDQASALGAVVENFGDGEARAAGGIETHQLGGGRGRRLERHRHISDCSGWLRRPPE